MGINERIDTLIKRLQKEFYNEHPEETRGKVMLEIIDEVDSEDNKILDFNIHIVDTKGQSYAQDTYATYLLDDTTKQEKTFKKLVVDKKIDLLPF